MKRADGTIDLAGVSPDVADLLISGQRRAASRALPQGKRRKAARDAARVRMTIDIHEALKAELENMANDLSVPVSQVAIWLILEGLYQHGDNVLNAMAVDRQLSRSMRFEYSLHWGDDGDAKRNR